VFNFVYLIFGVLLGVKHLGTCDLSGLWLLAEPSDQTFGRPGWPEFLKFFSLQNPNQSHCVSLVRKNVSPTHQSKTYTYSFIFF
jgi:hypothetical protein